MLVFIFFCREDMKYEVDWYEVVQLYLYTSTEYQQRMTERNLPEVCLKNVQPMLTIKVSCFFGLFLYFFTVNVILLEL